LYICDQCSTALQWEGIVHHGTLPTGWKEHYGQHYCAACLAIFAAEEKRQREITGASEPPDVTPPRPWVDDAT
jgi:hypothetical protein